MPRQSKPTTNKSKAKSNDAAYGGFDLSLTGTGVCFLNKEGRTLFAATLKNKLRGPERLIAIREILKKAVRAYNIKVVGLEDYAYAAAHGAAYAGELGGVVRVMLHEEGIPFFTVPPTRLKKFTSGGGKCEKSMVILKVYQQWGFSAEDDNQADAFGLAQIARCTKVRPVVLNAAQKEVIRDVLSPPVKKKRGKKDEHS